MHGIEVARVAFHKAGATGSVADRVAAAGPDRLRAPPPANPARIPTALIDGRVIDQCRWYELQGPQILTDTHVRTDAIAVKLWVEQLALTHGFETVVWDELPDGVGI